MLLSLKITIAFGAGMVAALRSRCRAERATLSCPASRNW
jgi:hypothetical protein